MPPARSQEVTLRRPLANRAPTSSRFSRGAERLSRTELSAQIQADSRAGRCDNGMTGSLGRDPSTKGHRVQGASLRPPTRVIHYAIPFRKLWPIREEVLESTGWCELGVMERIWAD